MAVLHCKVILTPAAPVKARTGFAVTTRPMGASAAMGLRLSCRSGVGDDCSSPVLLDGCPRRVETIKQALRG